MAKLFMMYIFIHMPIKSCCPHDEILHQWLFAQSDLNLRCAHMSAGRFSDLAAQVCITKTCLYNFDPLKPHFYIVKLGFTGVYIIFLISAQNIDCGYSLEPPR